MRDRRTRPAQWRPALIMITTVALSAGANLLPASASVPGVVLRADTDQPVFLANIDDDAQVCRERARKLVADAVAREQANDERFRREKERLRELSKVDKERADREWAALSKAHGAEQTKTDREMAACNDAADEQVNGAEDEADLARLRTVASPDVSPSASGRISLLDKGSEHVRLFAKRAGGWVVVGPDTTLSAEDLRHGVELGIEGRDVIRDAAVWDGRVTVRLTVTAGGAATHSDVQLRQAPVLTQHNAQKLDQVLISDQRKSGEGAAAFDKNLVTSLAAAGERPLRRLDTGDDKWTQDLFEPGYAWMPGPGGKPHGMRVMIQSVADYHRAASRVVFTELAGPDVAAVHVGHAFVTGERGSLDAMGNLETIPPHPGRPAGRIIVGTDPTQPGPASEVLTFLRSQGMQDPLGLDVSWLEIGHVDEFVQFLPAPGSRLGWRAVVADPRLGMELLAGAKAAGHAGLRLHTDLPPLSWPEDMHIDTRTIGEFLADEQFTRVNDLAAQKITANLDILRREAGLSEVDIVRVPALFTPKTMSYMLLETEIRGMDPGPKKTEAEARLHAMNKVGAEIPGTINGLVLDNGRYLAPKPFGPVINGKSIFADAITAAFRSTGYTVDYVDDLIYPHIAGGEIHCATNTLRAVPGL